MSVPVDWKPERAVQAKIRGKQKEYNPGGLKTRKGGPGKSRDYKIKKIKKSMTIEACPWESTLVRFAIGDFCLDFDNWAVSPRSAYFISGSTLTMIWFLSSDTIISNEVCRVFVLRCRSNSRLTRPILSHLQSYNHKSFIHTFMHIHIHAYTTCTQYHL